MSWVRDVAAHGVEPQERADDVVGDYGVDFVGEN